MTGHARLYPDTRGLLGLRSTGRYSVMAPTQRQATFIFFLFFQKIKSRIHDQIIPGLYTKLINLSPTTYEKMSKQKNKRERCLSYHHYSSSASSGRLQATDEGTLDDRDFEARWDRVQKTSSYPL
jgi:hypothetical protein